MARSKLSYRQIADLLLDLDCGMTGREVAAEYSVTPATVSIWKPYVGLTEKWLVHVKRLEHETKVLKRRAKYLEEQIGIAGTIIRQLEPNSMKRSLFAIAARAGFGICRARANQTVGAGPLAGALRAQREGEAKLIEVMRAYLQENPHLGFDKMFRVLLQDKGCTRFHAYTLYQRERLQLKFRKTRIKTPVKLATRSTIIGVPDQTWSIDFLVDELTTGRRIWIFNVVDIFNRECLCSIALFRASSVAVVAALESLRTSGRTPSNLRSDNGGEFKGLKYVEWTSRHHVKRRYSRPGHPIDNVFVERLHKTQREELFNVYRFKSLAEVQRQLDAWRIRYNLVRPHQALAGMSPVQFTQMANLRLA